MRPDRSAELNKLAPKNRKPLVAAGVVVCIVAIIAALSWAISAHESSSTNSSASLKQSSKYIADDGAGITPYADVHALPGAKQVDIYEDFQCPSCKMLEHNNGANLARLARAGKVKVTYHLMNFLDENLGNDASTRAANAAVCAAKAGKFMPLHDMIYANQPETEGKGYTNGDLIDFGKAVKVGGNYVNCVSDVRNRAWVL